MAQRQGFKNIQIQAKQDFFDLFEDTFEQSGANSKAEFARILIDNYLEPVDTQTPALRKIEESLKVSNEEKEILLARRRNERYPEETQR